MSLDTYLHNLGINLGQTVLMVGGLTISFILPMVIPRMGGIFPYLGIGMFAAGGAWFLVDKSKAVSNATFANPGGFYDPVSNAQKYSNPVNNFRDIKPRNRFDLSTNYILNEKNSNFDNYVNDIILNESKAMGLDLLNSNSYPERIDPWKVPQLNPTTPTTPSRDFNTVKMIA